MKDSAIVNLLKENKSLSLIELENQLEFEEGNQYPESYYCLGKLFEQKGMLEGAADYYRKAVGSSTQSFKYNFALGNVLDKLGKYSEALDQYEKASTRNPQNAWLHHRRGNVLIKLGLIQEAILAYKTAVENHSKKDNAWLYVDLGNALSALGKQKEANSSYSAALKIQPNSPEVSFQIGKSLLSQQKLDQSAYYFAYSLECQPNYPPAYQQLAKLFKCQGKPIETRQAERHLIPASFTKDYFVSKTVENVLKVKSFQHPSVQYKNTGSNKEISKDLTPPKTIDGGVDKLFDIHHLELEQRFVAKVPDARGWFSGGTNVVFANDKTILTDLSHGNSDWIACSQKLPAPQEISGNVLCLATPGSANIYCHWMIDLLSRLTDMSNAGELQQIDTYLVHRFHTKFQFETFKTLGIAASKVTETYCQPHIIAESLIFPSLRAANEIISKEEIEFLRKKFLVQNSQEISNDYPPRIYLSRKNAARRKIEDEGVVIDFLRQHGFVDIDPGAMSVSEQALLFSQAEAVISPHGAALTNILFCRPSTKVIEIFSRHISRHYWLIANQCNLNYFQLKCNSKHSEQDDGGKDNEFLSKNFANISIDINLLSQTMALAGLI